MSRLGLKLEPQALSITLPPIVCEEVDIQELEIALERLKASHPEYHNLIKNKIVGFCWALEPYMPSASAILSYEKDQFIFALDEPLKALFAQLSSKQIELTLYLLIVHESKALSISNGQTVYTDINLELAAFITKAEAYYMLNEEERELVKKAAQIMDRHEPNRINRFYPIFAFLDKYTIRTINKIKTPKSIINFLAADTRLNVKAYDEEKLRSYLNVQLRQKGIAIRIQQRIAFYVYKLYIMSYIKLKNIFEGIEKIHASIINQNFQMLDTLLKWLSFSTIILIICLLILTLLGIGEIGGIELKAVINILAITISVSLFSWGGINIFSIKRKIIGLERSKIENCPFSDIVDEACLEKFGFPGSVAFCSDLVQCPLRFECCKVHQNYMRLENDRQE